MNIYFGASGFAKEIEWLADVLYKKKEIDYKPDFYVTSDADNSVCNFINGIKIITESCFFEKYSSDAHNYFICVGDSSLKKNIVHKIKNSTNLCSFPSMVHPDVSFDSREGMVSIGEGVFICSKTVMTTNILIEDFVHINISCTVGHDCQLGRYSTVNPNVSISGNVCLEESVYIGTGAVILQGLSVCSGSVIGAGAVVTKSVSEIGTYVGAPARRMVRM